MRTGYRPAFPLAVSDDAHPLGLQPRKQLHAPAATIEQHRQPLTRRQPLLGIADDRFQHLRQASIHFARDHQQRRAVGIVQPGVGRCGGRQRPLRLLGLGQGFLAALLANVPVHVEKS